MLCWTSSEGSGWWKVTGLRLSGFKLAGSSCPSIWIAHRSLRSWTTEAIRPFHSGRDCRECTSTKEPAASSRYAFGINNFKFDFFRLSPSWVVSCKTNGFQQKRSWFFYWGPSGWFHGGNMSQFSPSKKSKHGHPKFHHIHISVYIEFLNSTKPTFPDWTNFIVQILQIPSNIQYNIIYANIPKNNST